MLGSSPQGQATAKALGLSLFGHSLNPWVDILIVTAFGAVMISLAVSSFSKQE